LEASVFNPCFICVQSVFHLWLPSAATHARAAKLRRVGRACETCSPASTKAY